MYRSAEETFLTKVSAVRNIVFHMSRFFPNFKRSTPKEPGKGTRESAI